MLERVEIKLPCKRWFLSYPHLLRCVCGIAMYERPILGTFFNTLPLSSHAEGALKHASA